MLSVKSAQALRTKMKVEWESLHQNTLDFAGLLYKAAMEVVRPSKGATPVPYFAHWTYASWEDYLKGEFGLSLSEGLLLARTYEFWCVTLTPGKHWKEPAVSIDKMALLQSAVAANPKQADQWLAKAALLTYPELQQEIAGRVGDSELSCIKIAGLRSKVVPAAAAFKALCDATGTRNRLQLFTRLVDFGLKNVGRFW